MSFMEGPGHAAFCGNDGPHEKHRHPLPDSYEVCSGVSARLDPVTAPDMVELGAMALFDDNPVWHLVHDRPALWGEVVASAKDRYRQQSRAVLAAISEAGTVEWGSRDRSGEVESWDDERDAQMMARGHAHEFVSRVTFPWERAE